MIIGRIAQQIGIEEHQPGIEDQKTAEIEGILHRVIRVERHRILRPLHINSERIVVSRHMQRPDVQHHQSCEHEWQQVMQAKEAMQRCIIDAKSAP